MKKQNNILNSLSSSLTKIGNKMKPKANIFFR